MRSISWFLTKGWLIALALVSAACAHADDFDLYNDGAEKYEAAMQTLAALGDDASDQERAAAVSEAIVTQIVISRNAEAWELFAAHKDLPLTPLARVAGLGQGVERFASDEMVPEYLDELKSLANGEPRPGSLVPSWSAHYVGQYYTVRMDDMPTSLKWHEKAATLAHRDLRPDDPTIINFETAFDNYQFNYSVPGAIERIDRTEQLALQILPPEHILWIAVYANQSRVASLRSRHRQAAQFWARIGDIAVNSFGEDDPRMFAVLQNQAMAFAGLGDYEVAEKVARLGIANGDRQPPVQMALQHSLTADLVHSQGRAADAVELYRKGLELLGDTPRDNLVWAFLELRMSRSLSALGQFEEAVPLAEGAVEAYKAKMPETHPAFSLVAWMAGLVKLRAGDASGALDIMQTTYGAREQTLLDLFARTQDRNAVAGGNGDLFKVTTAVALASDDLELGWRSAQIGTISDLAISAASLSYPGDAAGFSQALEEVQKARAAEELARSKMGNDAPSNAAMADAREARILAENALETNYPGFAEYLRPRPLTIAQASALLGDDEAYILPTTLADRIVTIAITSDGLVWDEVQSPLYSNRALIRRLRVSLDEGLASDDAFDAKAAHELYKRIFSPRVREAVAGKSKLIFPAGGALARIPPSTLVTQLPGEGRPMKFLVHDHAIALTPDLGSRAREKTKASRRFAGIGAPKLANTPQDRAALRGMTIDVESLKSLPSLPGALAELEALRAAFPGQDALLLTGEDATETAVRNAPLGDFSILAFATHGLVSGQIDGLTEPALVMTPKAQGAANDNDGLLTASEIAQLNLGAEWIILSACNTAAGDGRGNATYSGLARAFQLAGARSLLLSHWPVRDDAATRLTVATVSAAAKGTERSEALRLAKLELMADPKVKGGSSPSLWAPFVLIE